MDNEILREAITSAFNSLTKREEQVIRMRFGIIENLNEEYIHDVKEEK